MSNKWIDLKDKVVIVTGGSMGLGEKMVENLSSNGAKVVSVDLVDNPEHQNNPNIITVKCDISDKQSVEQMVEEVYEKTGRIDGLVNNAGVSRPRMLVDHYGEKPEYELSEEDFDFMVNINQKGVFLCAQAVARKMIKQESGVIINMSSEAGIEGSKGQSCYSGTKAAVHAFSLAWAKELGPFNIRVLGVAPAINERTPMNDDAAFNALAYTRGQDPNNISSDYSATIPLGRAGKIEEVADLISFLMSDHATYITGTTIAINGGKSRG